MQTPPLPADEQERLAQLARLSLVERETPAKLADLVQVAAGLANVPMAAVTLIDAQTLHIKAGVGLPAGTVPRDVSFCGHLVAQANEMLVPDTALDNRFHDNPLVLDTPYLKFYAGYPLRGRSGQVYGALCVLDTIPRVLTAEQHAALRELSRTATQLLEAAQQTSRPQEPR
jgi:GAF domain-containing protein